MAQTTALIGALKQALKSRGVTYAEVARRLSMSEASIKRVFAKETFTLRRLDEICRLLGIEITDLAKIVEHEADAVTHLTLEHEKQLVSSPGSCSPRSTRSMRGRWTTSSRATPSAKTECIRLLVRLDRLRIRRPASEQSHPGRRRPQFLMAARRPDPAPLRSQLEANFFASRFDGKGEQPAFVSGMLSRNSNTVVQHHMRRLGAEFTELHNQDVALPLDERFGTSLLIAIRPWSPEAFKKLERKPAQKAP